MDQACSSSAISCSRLRACAAREQCLALALAIAGVPSVLLEALTHQATFGNKLVAFLCGDASAVRSGDCIQLDGYVFGDTLGGLEPLHQFLEGQSPLALLLLELKRPVELGQKKAPDGPAIEYVKCFPTAFPEYQEWPS
jgi:hypothetical protein